MRIFLSILPLLVLFSCSSTRNLKTAQIIGKYTFRGFYGVGSTMELKADQSFEYHWRTGLLLGTTHGTWDNDGSTIILNSNLQPTDSVSNNFEIIGTEKKGSASLLIKVVGPENETIPYAMCDLKQGNEIITSAPTDEKGEVRFPMKEADSIVITNIGYSNIRYKLDSSITSYIFKVYEWTEYYKYFTNEKWQFKKQRLYDPSIKKSKFVKKNYYEKIH